eukprot:SAG22_NODE_1532_length_4207_cov_2.263632_3_plen_63_part_00
MQGTLLTHPCDCQWVPCSPGPRQLGTSPGSRRTSNMPGRVLDNDDGWIMGAHAGAEPLTPQV